MALRQGWYPNQHIVYSALTKYESGGLLNNPEVLIHFGTGTYPGSFFVGEKAVTIYYKAGHALKRITVLKQECSFRKRVRSSNSVNYDLYVKNCQCVHGIHLK